MMHNYYILIGRESRGPFEMIFGDYDRDVVLDEKEDMAQGYNNYTHLKVVTCGDTQAEIDAKIDEVNEKAGLC